MACADCKECPFEEDVGGIHEIHVSVPVEFEKEFYYVCKNIGVKGLSVKFTDVNGMPCRHVMTAEIFKGRSEDAHKKMLDIVNHLVTQGVPIDRQKIESSVSTKTPSFGYFERHIRYEVNETEIDRFFSLVKGNSVKVSYNEKHEGLIPLLTLKSEPDIESLEEFTERFNKFERMMNVNGFVAVKTMLERCWFDDNYEYDDVWSYV